MPNADLLDLVESTDAAVGGEVRVAASTGDDPERPGSTHYMPVIALGGAGTALPDTVFFCIDDAFLGSGAFAVADLRLATDHPAPGVRRNNASAAQRFSDLAGQWHQDTDHLSTMADILSHPAHLQIIGMREEALPLILRALRDNDGHWFPALQAITGRQVADDDCTYDEARERWLTWGMRNGHIGVLD